MTSEDSSEAIPPHSALQRDALGARRRILDTADRLFYGEGIHSVGIDRIIAESHVSKASFYKHFASKDTLIAEYLTRRHEQSVDAVDGTVRLPAVDRLRMLSAFIADAVKAPGFRGCPFMNAAAEYPEPGHVVRQAVTAQRDWLSETAWELLREAGHPLPGDAADDFVLARDGAMTGGYSGDPIAAVAALRRVTDRIVSEIEGGQRGSGAPAGVRSSKGLLETAPRVFSKQSENGIGVAYGS